MYQRKPTNFKFIDMSSEDEEEDKENYNKDKEN